MHTKNERICVNGAESELAVFDSGSRTLIILPGAGDAFKTVRGMALPLSLFYRKFSKVYTVYFISRRYQMPKGFTTADMADDIAQIMTQKQIACADVFGVSHGGMIAQQLALRHPDKVGRLVLAVTSAQMCDMTQQIFTDWLQWAQQGDWARIMQDTALRSYTDEYLRKNKLMLNLVNKHTKPAEPERFDVIVRSCLSHNVLDLLDGIRNPTLVIGVEKDRIVGAEASKRIAAQIPDSQLIMYDAYSHGVYDEAADFYDRVLEWLTEPERSKSDA